MKEINICKVAKILCTFALVAMTADVSAHGKDNKNNLQSQTKNNPTVVVAPVIVRGTGTVADLLRDEKDKDRFAKVVNVINSQVNNLGRLRIINHSEEHYYGGGKDWFLSLQKQDHTYFGKLLSKFSERNTRLVFSSVIKCLKSGIFDELVYSATNQLSVRIKTSRLGLGILGGEVFHWIRTANNQAEHYVSVDPKNDEIRCIINFDNDGKTIITLGGPGTSGSCYPEIGTMIRDR